MASQLVNLAGRLPPGLRAALLGSPLGPLVHRLMGTAAGEQLAVVALHGPLAGHRMRLDLRYQRGMAYGDYERDVVAALQRWVQPGWTVADVGAQIGYMTLLLAKLVGPAGRVFAFEPMPANFAALQENILLNGYQTVRAERRAVADRTGVVGLRRVDDRVLSATASLVAAGDDTLDVEAVSLDEYFEGLERPLRFIKLDVEGAENLVLDGAQRVIERDRPLLLVEVHDLGGPPNPTVDRLRGLGYELRPVGSASSAPLDAHFLGHVLALPHPSS